MGNETKHDAEAVGPAQVPPDCFRLEELETFQSLENKMLVEANYYLWLRTNPTETPEAHGFLYFLELIFESHDPLLLTYGEDSAAIHIGTAAHLLDTAQRLQSLHGYAAIRRIRANTSSIWQPLIGQSLNAIHLARHESGLYANSALQLDFGDRQVVVQLAATEGLEIINEFHDEI